MGALVHPETPIYLTFFSGGPITEFLSAMFEKASDRAGAAQSI
jgi:hypothetical protein